MSIHMPSAKARTEDGERPIITTALTDRQMNKRKALKSGDFKAFMVDDQGLECDII